MYDTCLSCQKLKPQNNMKKTQELHSKELAEQRYRDSNSSKCHQTKSVIIKLVILVVKNK